jgi:hypothetical protein
MPATCEQPVVLLLEDDETLLNAGNETTSGGATSVVDAREFFHWSRLTKTTGANGMRWRRAREFDAIPRKYAFGAE